MGRRAEEQELSRAQAQDLTSGGVGAFERPLDQGAERLVDLAQPAQRRGQQQTNEGAVAGVEADEALVAGQRIVQRLALVEAGDQQVERDAPGGERGGIHCAAL